MKTKKKCKIDLKCNLVCLFSRKINKFPTDWIITFVKQMYFESLNSLTKRHLVNEFHEIDL